MFRPATRIALAASLALITLSTIGRAQMPAHDDDHDDDHDHGHLHFSHPLVTESPSPDTKLRVDYLWTRTGPSAERVTDRSARIEGEYAFGPALSLAVTVPYVWRSATGPGDVHGFGNTELSLKAASVRWGEHGVLVGGGLSTGLPTGSDERGIGTSRAIELEPFADAAWKRGALELVGFGHYGQTVRNPAGTDTERELAFNGSVLYPAARAVEVLLEVEAVHNVAGPDIANELSLAPGIKLYPFSNRQLMAGISVPFGVGGEARDSRGIMISAFYHF